MEKRKVVSRILELQNSAAKSTTLESQNDQYAKRTDEMQDEIRRLRSNLKQVEAEKNTFERDLAIFITENKNLNQQVTVLKSAHDNNASTAARLLHEIKDGNKKLMSLREEEFKSNLESLKEELATSRAEWSDKVKSLEKKTFTLRGEKRDLEKETESLRSELGTHKTKAETSTSNLESVKQKLMRKSAEVQELNKTVKELEARLSNVEKVNSSNSMKSKIQIQAIETKVQKADDEKNKLIEAHKEELRTLRCQLEEREKQLGAQSNTNRRMQSDLKSEIDAAKEDFRTEVKKNKELTTQITRLEIRVKAANENVKHTDEENKVKMKCLEDQVDVLQKEITSKSTKMEELKSELYETHNTNSGELQDLRSKILILKNEKRNALAKATEVTEELESLKKGLNRELETMKDGHKQEMEKLRSQTREKEKHTAAQSCITRKVQEDMKRQLESEKTELENEKLRNSDLMREQKSLELQLKSAQESLRSLDDDNSLKLRLAEEKVSALQQEMTIKNKKMHELQKQVLDAQELNGKDVEELTEKLATTKRDKRSAQDRISELLEENNRLERQKSKAEISFKSQKDKQESALYELEQAEKKCKSLEEKCTELQRVLDSQSSSRDTSLQRMREEITQLKARKRSLESENKANEDLESEVAVLKKKLSAVETKAKETESKLRSDVRSAEKEVNDVELEYKQQITDLQEKLSETQRKLAAKNITSVTMCKKAEDDFQKQLQEIESREKGIIANLRKELVDTRKELGSIKEEKEAIEEKFVTLRENCSIIETMEEQLEDYHEKCQQLQEQNSSLIEKLTVATREKGDANKKAENQRHESTESREKMKQQEKALEALKQSCVMLEEQVVELEKFNDELLKNQKELLEEKETTVKECREVKRKLGEVEHLVTIEKRRGEEREENNSEEFIELQVKVREEANKAQELQDEISDLDRKYKLLEMHANQLQKKLINEKENSERLREEADGYRNRMDTLESIRHQTSSGLRSEVERVNALAHEKTELQNEMDTLKMKQSHERIKMNCTIGQQSKLIDFLQAKVESLEPQDKKKKKKKNDLYQVPLQYRELQDMLEESKQTNIQLQQKVNDLRTELQNAKSDVSRLKHGINGATPGTSHTLSPGSIAAISALVKSPNLSSPLAGNSKSKPRMHHNIPHRLSENLCTRATKCVVCLDSVRFGRVSLRCTECDSWCHVKCRSNMTSTCGLPGGLVQHYKQGGKAATASPVSCITINDGDGNVQGWLKVYCGGSSWEKKWIQLRDGVMIISNNEKPITSSKRVKIDVNNKDREVVDLVQQQGYVHATVPASELEMSAKADIPYVFKLELGPDTSCWPPRNLYFLPNGFSDKQKWVAALETITTRNSAVQNTINDSKVIGNKIVTLQVNQKLEINCSLPVSKEKVLFGCDEGLFLLPPSTSSVCDRSHVAKVTGAQQILQMEFLKSPNLIVAIEGTKRRIVTFDASNLISSSGRPSDLSVKLIPVEYLVGCHLFAIGSVEGAPHLCSATAASIQIHRFNSQLGKFVKRKEIATSEPCTCLQFTMCSIIMGTNQFYEIELKSYKVDEFLDARDRSLLFDYDSFPVAVLQIGQNNGKYEYLLCYHEFGVFVDCFGKRTRKDNITWSRLPLSFAYKSPYLIATHFHSVEILRIERSRDYNDNLTLQQAYLNLPSPRYLGPAITEGAAYISANEGGKITVFCAKGNMEQLCMKENVDGVTSNLKSGVKRRKMQLAASSQESLEDFGTRAKRTLRSSSIESSNTLLSDTTNFSVSCESLLSSNTSRWTLESKLSHFPPDTPRTSVPKRIRTASYDSLDSIGTMSSEAAYSKYSEDDTASTQSGGSSRMMWRPVTPSSGKKQPPEKPIRKNKTPSKIKFDPIDI